MDEERVWSAMAVATWGAWVAVTALIWGMWMAVLFDYGWLAPAFGFTACAGSAVAATLHIRRFTCRTQALIRSLVGHDELRERELFEMGRDSVTELHPHR